MTKKILLTAVAVGAVAFASAAAAQVTPRSLTFRTTAAAGDIDAGVTGSPTGTYRLAEEVNLAPTASNTVALIDTLSTGASLPSGNVILTVSLTGATFGTTFGSAGVNVTGIAGCAGFTAVPSTGGAGTDSTATFVISNSSSTCNAFNLDVPVRPSGTGPVTVTSNLRTDGNPGTPLDGGSVSRQVISRVNAFQVVVDGAIGAGALADTFADLNTIPPYAAFDHTGPAPESAQLGQLGTLRILVDTTAFADLTTTNPVVVGDVTDADVTVTGSFTAFDGAGGAVTLGAVAATVPTGAATAVINNQQGALTAGAVPFQVDPETGANIPVSNYVASVAYTLASEFTPEGPAGGALETIGREGTNVLLPWMNSQSIAAANGTNNIVRISNTGGQAASVSGDVVTASNSATGYVDQGIVSLGSVPAGGELVLTAAQLAPLGNFGRGDVQLIIESSPLQITVKRFAILANGNVAEFESGSVASDQNAVNVP